jgi:hypothetical protein
LGRLGRPEEQRDADERRFEAELQVQEGNITEVGEDRATRGLRHSWDAFRKAFGAFRDGPRMPESYLSDLRPLETQVGKYADDVLALNMDAMVRKNEIVHRQIERYQVLLIGLVLSASILGLALAGALMARFLRPFARWGSCGKRCGASARETWQRESPCPVPTSWPPLRGTST